jgi:hypothetical protein
MTQVLSPSLIGSRWGGLSLRRRRLFGCAATILAIELMWSVRKIVVANLGHGAVFSGAVLLACLFLLVAIGVRRRMTFLPIWSVSTWMQIHLYTGMFAIAAFVIHVPRIVAAGRFEAGLSWLFWGVSASGLYGLYSARSIPKRLTAIGIEPRYDRIAWHRDQVLRAAETEHASLTIAQGGEVLSGFYDRVLRRYFQSGLPIAFRFRPSERRRQAILAELGDLRRYFDAETCGTADRMAALVRRRDQIDYHHGLQWRLRAWVALHASLSIVLVVWAVAHAVVALSMLGRS